MRSVVSYSSAAALVVLMMNVITPPAGFGLAVGAWPSNDGNAGPQIVDRTHKSDRLQFPSANNRRSTPSGNPAMLIGCEPVFSALSSGGRANFAGRCVS